MEKQKARIEVQGFEAFKRSQVTKNFDWHRNGYWMNKPDGSHRREAGKFCGECILPLTEVSRTRDATAHLKCEECGKEIGKRDKVYD